LLYSEHLLGLALFTAPVQWATGNPIFVYNLAFLASFVITGCGMYVLARWLTGRRDAALIAAVVFAFKPLPSVSSVAHSTLGHGMAPAERLGASALFPNAALA
jgi:hypothetical protein